MIRDSEIKKRARKNGVPASTIERDYTQSWFLKNLANDDMLLKGGTGIKKVYFDDYRFSDDLDFTLVKGLDKEDFRILTKEAIEKTVNESGINFEEDFKIDEVKNGFKIEVYFRILRTSGSPLKIKIDMTDTDKEKVVLSPEYRKIFHSYSDQIDEKVKCYPLEEIIAEKIRSLFERTRPRDLYDIWKLYEKIDEDTVEDVLKEKCDFKEIERELDELQGREEDYQNSWENSLKHQMEEVPEFEDVFDYVLNEVLI
ncbi:MAG: nucleotidyl transferase AbiEii/AbiGii toxin family protein [Candidatus Natronoplasma sp.]